MDLFNLILTLLVLVETTALSAKSFVGTSRKKAAKNARRRVFVDTSTLMDGRILSVARAGFLGDEILIPRSVIRELQLLADGNDSEKRTRARYGLDIISDLENERSACVSVFPDETGSRTKVDERLLDLAREHNGIILTNDFNLAKVAATEQIVAININDLAQGLRSEYLPGDKISVRIISVGSNPKQGVAYLPDGTMVVVDDAERYAGKNLPIEIEFVRYLQTNAGKMMFAKIAEKKVLPTNINVEAKLKQKATGRKKPSKPATASKPAVISKPAATNKSAATKKPTAKKPAAAAKKPAEVVKNSVTKTDKKSTQNRSTKKQNSHHQKARQKNN